jgi:thymidine kinase
MSNGKLTVITGPMFSGKSTELLRELRRAKLAELGVQAFVHAKDTRRGVGNLISHDRQDAEAFGLSPTALPDAHELAMRVRSSIKVVGIDEAQFFGPELVEQVIKLVEARKRVFVAGLDLTYRGVPFGPLPQLLAYADDVRKLTAVCYYCKGEATRTVRYAGGSTDDTLIGAEEAYRASCLACTVTQC